MSNHESADLDIQLEAAAEVLQKVAADEGVDLNTVDEATIAALMGDILGLKTAAAEPAATEVTEPELKTASPAEDTQMINPAVVAQELTKQAALENIDLTTLTPEEYQACYEKVASDLQDPEYAEKIAAAQLEQEKFAEQAAQMEELGRYAGRGFIDEINKLAAKDDKEDEEDEGGEKDEKDEKDEGKKENPFAKKAGYHDTMAEVGGKVRKNKALQTGLGALSGGATGGLIGHEVAKKNKVLGAAIGALAGAGAMGSLGHHAAKGEQKWQDSLKDKKASIEEAAVKLARDVLVENGIDPDTGTKVAEASDEELIKARAVELLKEAGYEV